MSKEAPSLDLTPLAQNKDTNKDKEMIKFDPNRETWDYVIVGAGPGGLTLAWCLANLGQRCVIIEREAVVGGCHRVRRVKGLFTEHGPRVYTDAACTFFSLMDDLNIDSRKLFVPYKFGKMKDVLDYVKKFRSYELFHLFVAFMRLTMGDEQSLKSETVWEFAQYHKFCQQTIILLDVVCMMTEGARADRYTMYEFLQILNQHAFYSILQPTKPNDVGLFAYWVEALRKTGKVEFRMNEQVQSIQVDSADPDPSSVEHFNTNRVTALITERGPVVGKRYLFAIPMEHVVQILENSKAPVRNIFGNYEKLRVYERNIRYDIYLPVVFHWDRKLDLPSRWGLPGGDWGILNVVLSDYMEFEESSSKTVISTCIAKLDYPSSIIGKTANECGEEEMLREIFRQLQKELGVTLPIPTAMILSPGVSRINGRWATIDTANVLTTKGYLSGQTSRASNLWWTGTHQGHSGYNFTSIESACSNAIHLVNTLYPKSRVRFRLQSPKTLIDYLLRPIIAMIFLILMWYYVIKR